MANTFAFDNTYANEMDGFYQPASAAQFPSPSLLKLNEGLATELGLDPNVLKTHGDDFFSGRRLPEGAKPIAQAYAGHQFGGFNPQLGDGRAMLLGEIIDPTGKRFDIQLKGSGPTHFSRGGDGLAAVGPVLREYLVGEAMHALGVPTTRMLAAVSTGRPVFRETPLPGAVVTRVASSHLRVGTFEFFAARQDRVRLEKLVQYTLKRHFPDQLDGDDPTMALLTCVAQAQAHLISRWMLIGFIHGVMNTDNTAISGETIDYGPCAFMDRYDPQTVFSSIDRHGRYAYGNQAGIALWNLSRFAEALLVLAEDPESKAEKARSILSEFPAQCESNWLAGMHQKLGFTLDKPVDSSLANDWIQLLKNEGLDYTRSMRDLGDAIAGDDSALLNHCTNPEPMTVWLTRWRTAHGSSDIKAIQSRMHATNPLYIPRNHLVEEALAAASDRRDLGPFNALLERVTQPYTRVYGQERYAKPAPDAFTKCYKTFCGT